MVFFGIYDMSRFDCLTYGDGVFFFCCWYSFWVRSGGEEGDCGCSFLRFCGWFILCTRRSVR